MKNMKIPAVSSIILILILMALTLYSIHIDQESNMPEVCEAPPSIEQTKEEEIIDTPSTLSQEETELLALVTMAEAEGEPEEGKRLVIDVILNRVDSPYFPNTVTDVIYQKNQFTSMWNGRVERCEVRVDILNLVQEELENRTNKNVVFFRTERYSDFGIPVFKVGNHYFSKYE